MHCTELLRPGASEPDKVMASFNCSKCIRNMVTWNMVSHLKWADIVAEYALFLLMTYLTDKWELGFAHAAGIINIWTGVSKTLTLLGAFIVDKIGNYKMLLFSSIAYSIGLAFIYMSTPPVLANTAGNCGYYRAECFGQAQKAMFYTSLVLIAVGMAGHTVSLDPFIDEQTADVNDDKKPKVQDGDKKPKGQDDEPFCTIKNLGNMFVRALVSGVASLALPSDWAIRFGVAAIYTIVATIVFVIGTPFYDIQNKPKESGTKINFCDMFRETAAVWSSFIMCGVVSSIGNTFFVEQADKMEPMLGKWHVPLAILLLLSKAARIILVFCYNTVVYKFIMQKCFKCCGYKELAALFGIGIAMLNAVLCCLTAALVENVRRKNSMGKYLHDKSIFWLVPQFFFLIGIDAFLEESVKDFFENYAPRYKSSDPEQASKDQSMKKYIICFKHFVIGLGFIGSVVSVLAVAKISQRVARKSWFQKQVNDSHLENYYWVLTVLSGINIIHYVVAAICYSKKNSKREPAAAHQANAKSACC